MLAKLSVRDYAIIDEISICLDVGLNVLTGETGAGKSIIVGALSFVLGEKVSDDIVRHGKDSCRVEALFRVPRGGLARSLGAAGFVPPDGGDLRLTRQMKRGGRSKASVNGRTVSIAELRKLGDLLVDFHGQHEHQLLLRAGSHIDFLDGFARLYDEREKLADRRQGLLQLTKRIRDLEQEIAYIRSKEQFIRYEISEIEQIGPKDNEDIELEQEIGLLEHAEKIIEAGSGAMEAIYDGDDAAIRQISQAQALLQRIARYSGELASLAESLEQARLIVKDVAETLRDQVLQIDLDPTRLENLRDRLAVLERVKRKYGETIADVLEHLRRLKQGLENRDGLDLELHELLSQRKACEGEVAALAQELSRKRRRAARRFEKLIESELASLGIEGGGFKAVFEEIDDGENVADETGNTLRVGERGMDSVEFFVRTNIGEDVLPLRRIASGGEISRVMLSLKRILADVDQVGTLVFDEIDAGIGGSLAGVVGAKLREVADSRQVICITHLPQIAAPAELHLAIGKTSVRGRTVTQVMQVDGEARVAELARMIGGAKAPESARLHAEEILKRSEVK